jgi:hypothetical protein
LLTLAGTGAYQVGAEFDLPRISVGGAGFHQIPAFPFDSFGWSEAGFSHCKGFHQRASHRRCINHYHVRHCRMKTEDADREPDVQIDLAGFTRPLSS